MKLHWMPALFFGLAACLFFHAGGLAGGKKDDSKKAEKGQELVIDGELVDADLKDKVRQQSYCKIFSFKMTEGKTYQIDMKSKSVDSYLRLENPAGQEVAKDDDSGGFPDARIIYLAPKSGEYQIIATTFGGGTGKFTLMVKEAGGAAPGKSVELKLDKGEAKHDGNLAANDPLYNGKRHKLFTFNMEAGKTYQIDMKSAAIDSYLFLEDPNGGLLAKDDDSGGMLDARIIHKATVSGKHRIIATCFGAANTGAFSLTVRQADADK